MSDRPPPRPSQEPKPSKAPPKGDKGATARSGQHPAVKAYRAKLESIAENPAGAANKLDKLDRDLEEFLADLKSSHPPPPEEEGSPSTERGGV